MTDETPWLSAEQLDAWITLSALLEALPTSIDNQLKRDVGINSFEYTVLAMLSEHPDHMLSMSELADMSFSSLSRLSHAAKRLESRGWVARRAGSGGRRHNVVSLTTEGHDEIRAAAPAHVAHVRTLLVDALTERELAAFAKIGKKLLYAADSDFHDHVTRLIPDIVARNRQ